MTVFIILFAIVITLLLNLIFVRKIANKTYPESKLTRRLDKLSGLYLASDNNNNLVEQKIASNGFYRSQYGF